MPRCLEIPELVDAHFNPQVVLPYDLELEEVKGAMMHVYDTLHIINEILFERAEERLEDIILGNSFSGIISELVIKAIADKSSSLMRNERIGGHPDLLPIGLYQTDSILHGEYGIEIKSSKQSGGWQGHNPEESWVMIFRYTLDTEIEPIEDREPSRFIQVVIAELNEDDWSFSGRVGDSRRTPIASITKSGMDKLRSNPVYQEPDAVVWPNRFSYEALYGKLL